MSAATPAWRAAKAPDAPARQARHQGSPIKCTVTVILDRSRIDLGTPDLFTQHPNKEARAYTATIRGNSIPHPGEDLCIRFEGGKVVAQRGMEIVAEFDDPPTKLLEALEESYGEACGTVKDVYEIAETVEIAVC